MGERDVARRLTVIGVGQRFGASQAARRRGCRGRPRGRRGRGRARGCVPHEPAPMTAARRTLRACRPATPTAARRRARCDRSPRRPGGGSAPATCGKVSGAPARMRTLCGRMRQPLRTASEPMMATGTTGAPVSSARRPTPRFGRPSAPGRVRVPSGKMRTPSPRSRIALVVAIASWSPPSRSIGYAPRRASSQAAGRLMKRLLLGHEVDRPAGHDRDDEGVQERPVVGRDDERPLRRDVLAPDAAQPPVEVEERLQDRSQAPVHERVHAAPARAIQKGVAIHAFDTRHWWPRLQFADADRSRTDSPRSPRRSHRRRGVVGPGAARHARLRSRLLRRGAARQGRDPRPGVARGRRRAAPAQRRRLRRRLRERRARACRCRRGPAARRSR